MLRDENEELDEYLKRQLVGAKAHKRNKMLQEARAKYRAADDICYGNSYKIQKQRRHSKGY